MSIVRKHIQSAFGGRAAGPTEKPAGPLMMTLWFGLLAGWLELGFVTLQSVVRPRVLPEMIRTNQHRVWMLPVSLFMIFGLVGLMIGLLARCHRGVGNWVALRLPVAIAALSLFLNVEGLYPSACAILACGIAAVVGRRLTRCADGFGRRVRMTFPVLAASFVLLVGFGFARVASSERRALASCPPAKPGAPNVLLIVLDTVRASCLSLYGHNRPTTPNLERLAKKGIVFTEARSTAPWTSPTHASMLTGRWPHELSIAPSVPLDRTYPTLAEVLAKQGYATAGFVGNIYYCNALYGMDRGFARYDDAYENQTVSLFETLWNSAIGKRVIQTLGYSRQLDDGVTLRRKSAEMLNRDVLDWLAAKPAKQPFFAFINYYDAHRPYVLNGESDLRFGLASLPIDAQRKIDKTFQDVAEGKPAPPDLTPEQISNDLIDLYHDSYDSCIAYLDRQVGRLVDEIDKRGLLDNTLVIVTSDHGEAMGEHGLIIHGASVYREETHVPLLVVPPARGSTKMRVREPVSVREIPATVAEWVDLGAGSPFPGRSLSRFLREDAAERGATSGVLCELQHNIAFPPTEPIPSPFGLASSLVWREHVYIRRDDGSEELYDLERDPGESNDIAKLPPSQLVLGRLRDELNRLRGENRK